jgi:hypothetical protein
LVSRASALAAPTREASTIGLSIAETLGIPGSTEATTIESVSRKRRRLDGPPPYYDTDAEFQTAKEKALAGKRKRGDEDKAEDGKPVTFTPTPFRWRDPSTLPRRQFVYGSHYARKFLSVTAAQTKVGKSSLVLVEAVAMAGGIDLLGIEPIQPMRVWYWNGEDPREEIERRVLAICLHFNINPREVEKNLFLDSGRDTEIIVATRQSREPSSQPRLRTPSPPRSLKAGSTFSSSIQPWPFTASRKTTTRR